MFKFSRRKLTFVINNTTLWYLLRGGIRRRSQIKNKKRERANKNRRNSHKSLFIVCLDEIRKSFDFSFFYCWINLESDKIQEN